ncbi:hypothetical protein BC834DRAFT_972041 [Gloeopeniophorella convolvens]|nr:hypothetical protein BC834DRAFT_972041 [Gloeopeniophorella convolvens]
MSGDRGNQNNGEDQRDVPHPVWGSAHPATIDEIVVRLLLQFPEMEYEPTFAAEIARAVNAWSRDNNVYPRTLQGFHEGYIRDARIRNRIRERMIESALDVCTGLERLCGVGFHLVLFQGEQHRSLARSPPQQVNLDPTNIRVHSSNIFRSDRRIFQSSLSDIEYICRLHLGPSFMQDWRLRAVSSRYLSAASLNTSPVPRTESVVPRRAGNNTGNNQEQVPLAPPLNSSTPPRQDSPSPSNDSETPVSWESLNSFIQATFPPGRVASRAGARAVASPRSGAQAGSSARPVTPPPSSSSTAAQVPVSPTSGIASRMETMAMSTHRGRSVMTASVPGAARAATAAASTTTTAASAAPTATPEPTPSINPPSFPERGWSYRFQPMTELPPLAIEFLSVLNPSPSAEEVLAICQVCMPGTREQAFITFLGLNLPAARALAQYIDGAAP